jgi:hypothetical protein
MWPWKPTTLAAAGSVVAAAGPGGGIHLPLDELDPSRSQLNEQAKKPGGQLMLRSVLLAATAAVMMSPIVAMADNKSDCQKGVAMIKAELKKKHPAPVLVTLRKALSDAETEVIEEDWSECMDHIKTARAALGK